MGLKAKSRDCAEKTAAKRTRQSSLSRVVPMRRLLFALVFVGALPAHGQVRAWEGVLELPAYEEGAPDPNPSFDQFETSRFSYPYTLRKEMTNVRATHQFHSIYLENEYLKCSVLP